MGEMAQCQECKRYGYTEIHHIVERSHAKYMTNIKVNFVNLCPECHRTGKYAIHKDRNVDLRYKMNMQAFLQELFYKEYYNVHQIKNMLEISKSEAEKLCKRLPIYKEGYSSKDLTFHMMGDRNYL